MRKQIRELIVGRIFSRAARTGPLPSQDVEFSYKLKNPAWWSDWFDLKCPVAPCISCSTGTLVLGERALYKCACGILLSSLCFFVAARLERERQKEMRRFVYLSLCFFVADREKKERDVFHRKRGVGLTHAARWPVSP